MKLSFFTRGGGPKSLKFEPRPTTAPAGGPRRFPPAARASWPRAAATARGDHTIANGTARQYKNHASETTQGLFYYWFVQRRAAEAHYVPRAVYNWQVPADRHDVRSLDVARLAHFTHCGKPPAKVNGRYDACGLLHREWRETWARVAAESGVVA